MVKQITLVLFPSTFTITSTSTQEPLPWMPRQERKAGRQTDRQTPLQDRQTPLEKDKLNQRKEETKQHKLT